MTTHKNIPLAWLRTFEVVARNLSVSRAAEELCVSPSAVSQQLRNLEEKIQSTLISRLGNKLILTDVGENLYKSISTSFSRIYEAIHDTSLQAGSGILNVSVAPSLAIKWLMPRLQRFYDRCPNINLSVFTSMDIASFDGNGIDVAIRYGSGLYPGLIATRLMSEHVVGVCSPALIERHGALERSSDLRKFRLLHEMAQEADRSCPTWSTVFKARGIEDVEIDQGPRFNQASMMVDAAIEGHGIALAKGRIVESALARGQLVPIMDLKYDVEFSYYAVCLPHKAKLEKISTFLDWLREEAEQ